MIGGHADAVQDSFSSQAAAFEDRCLNRVFTTDIRWLLERLA